MLKRGDRERETFFFVMASIAGLYGGFAASNEDGGGGGRGNMFSKFKKDLIKEQAHQAAAKREDQ